MNSAPVLTLALAFALASSSPGWAQSAPAVAPPTQGTTTAAPATTRALTPATPAPAATSTALPSGEPNVKRTVIEDEGTRIEELRVRGQPQRIVVTPKGGGKLPYEIITGDGSRDLSPGANTSRGAAGKRVWNVLSF